MKAQFKISDKFDLGLNASYTKYLTTPELESHERLKEYDFVRKIKGLELNDNIGKFELNGRYKVKDNLELNFNYNGDTTNKHTIISGLKFEF